MEKNNIVAGDGNLSFLQDLQKNLEQEYNVSMHTNGQSVLDYLQDNVVDLILLDTELPDEDGFVILEQVKANPQLQHLPVILLSSTIDRQSEVAGFSFGAVDFICKDSAPQSILARLRVHLDIAQRRRSLEKMLAEKSAVVEMMQGAVLVGLSDLIECRDDETAGHTFRTTEYVGTLCSQLIRTGIYAEQLDEETFHNILRAAPLHDIGKVGIHDNILLKPGRFTPEEFQVMKQHVVLGAKVIQRAIVEQGEQHFLKTAHDIVLHHHERWDGTGYPDGLKGEDIPLCGRIMSIADVYDALVADRPYKKAFSHEKALEIMLNEKGKQFDPLLIEAFESVCEDFRGISELINAKGGE